MNEQFIDKAKEVRTTEQLPLEKLDVWLKQNIANLSGIPELTQYTVALRTGPIA